MTLSTGRREIGGGFERYTFEIGMSAVKAMAGRARGSDAVMKQIVVGWYLLSPRPDPRDIMSIKISPRAGGQAQIELVIRRGHYQLLDVLRAYGGAVVSYNPTSKAWQVNHTSPDGDGELICYILDNALPNYNKEI